MPVLVTGIHVFVCRDEGVDGRNKSGHDEVWTARLYKGVAYQSR